MYIWDEWPEFFRVYERVQCQLIVPSANGQIDRVSDSVCDMARCKRPRGDDWEQRQKISACSPAMSAHDSDSRVPRSGG